MRKLSLLDAAVAAYLRSNQTAAAPVAEDADSRHWRTGDDLELQFGDWRTAGYYYS